MELDCRYVLHIPLSRWENGKIMPLDMDEPISELMELLEDKGFDSFYVTKVEGHYKSRKYDELLVTIFADDDDSPIAIFRQWFSKNNGKLRQEAFAYEFNNRMIVENLRLTK